MAKDKKESKAQDALPVKSQIKIMGPKKRKAFNPSLKSTIRQQRQKSIQQLYYSIYRKHPWIRSGVTRKARIVSMSGWTIESTDGKTKEDARKNQIENFFKFPNQFESMVDILYKTSIQLDLFNVTYWEIVKDSDGDPIDFYSMDGAIDVKVDKHGLPLSPAYVQKIGQNIATFSYDELLRFVVPDPRTNLDPSSDMEALEKTLLLDVNAMNLNHDKQKNGVRSGKAFIFPADLSPEQMKRNETEVHNLAGGVTGAFSAFLALQGDLTIQDLQIAEAEMEQKDLREFNRDEIAAVLGIPVSKMGITGVQVKEGEYLTKTFIEEDIWPRLQLIQNTLNRYFRLMGIDDYMFVFEPPRSRDMREVGRLIDVLKKYGVISINEARRMAGLKPIPNGDDYFVILKDGSIIIVDEMEAENAKQEQRVPEKQSSAPFKYAYQGGVKKVQRYDVMDEDAINDINVYEEDLDEDAPNPFGQ